MEGSRRSWPVVIMPRSSHLPLSLRPVTADDLPFLHALYAETRAREIAGLDWPEETRTAFLRGQFEAQDRHYRQRFPQGAFNVVVAGGKAVGRFYVARGSTEIRVVEITLTEACRGRGWGSLLLRKLCAEADGLGLPVRLQVDAQNRAQRLYRRLGFRETGREGPYVSMERGVGEAKDRRN